MSVENNKDVLEEVPAAIEQDITPRDMMKFAKSILLTLALIFILGGLSQLLKPDSGIFEACKTILPPIATLVIGYYFGKSG
ncbi:MAG TPA: hypothetical protein VJ279_08345 [Hanamia sp.]|jgi:hypothetical protein|nr:hypothetical protein [Hanamia sp.]